MFRFLPWKFFVKWAARRHGVLDPATLLARLRRFSQPSEVAEPIELLRAGIVFHARGLVNAKAIQHNLDWVWPYWVERQFNPNDTSFIPRAFSFSHINLSHRNWTSAALPGLAIYPIVDPRGLLTPLYDGWSLDFWIITEDGEGLLPSKLTDEQVTQQLALGEDLEILTECVRSGKNLRSTVKLLPQPSNRVIARTVIEAASGQPAWLVVAVRPYNPEGVQFIHGIEVTEGARGLRVNGETTVSFDAIPDDHRMAHYAEGDVYHDVRSGESRRSIQCETGMATAAALFRLTPGEQRRLQVDVDLQRDLEECVGPREPGLSWKKALEGNAELRVADAKMQFLYDAAMRTILMLSAGDLVPGPYTYRRFWFRDACLMLHPLLLIGQVGRVERIIQGFPQRQTMAGYFLSQEGEWDSNGQVLWIAARYAQITGKPLGSALDHSLKRGMEWLARKRLSGANNPATDGLLPAGFSAEHLGPNDFYYWDDFWAWAGLDAISRHWLAVGNLTDGERAAELAREFAASIEKSISSIPPERAAGRIPAAPGRRMDAGAIGSLVADYPLKLYPAGDQRVAKTVDFLIDHCFVKGGFFQEMIHSGINAYLTLDIAQTLLRAGDPRFADLIRRVAELASPTGQWPEAIHPQTLGGCMGDGQHGWAAAEWIMMMRNCFVREEKDVVILGSGILPEWAGESGMAFGPTLTTWGAVSVSLDGDRFHLDAKWHAAAPRVRIAVPGFSPIDAGAGQTHFQLTRP